MAFIYLIPTLLEAYQDRHGETARDKVKDLLWVVVVSIAIIWATWFWFDKDPITSALLVLGWRILVFDYLVTWLLIRNKVIEDPDARWWSYTGKTARFDKLVAKIPWRWRLGIRVALFATAVAWFIIPT